MATIDYEKKYKEALEKARQLCAYPTTKPFTSDLQDLFPELRELDGEKIRKEIIEYIKTGTYHKDWIAWIEKQQNPVGFNIGDEITVNGQVCRVVAIDKDAWSEEDINHVKSILSTIECCKDQFPNSQAVVEAYNADIDWLKNLRPQSQWKPSDLPHWKKSTLPNDNTTGFNSDYFCHNGYNINYKELFEKLPKDD